MKKYIFILLASLFTTVIVNAQARPASEVLAAARQQAARENKKVLVIFHASWCVWCRKMDSSLADRSISAFFNRNYVITHLTIMESADKKNLENPGAMEIYTSQGGNDAQGIPFWIIYDKDGNVLADSQVSPGKNSGCPATKEEVQHLVEVLRRTSDMTPAQLALVEARFRKNDL